MSSKVMSSFIQGNVPLHAPNSNADEDLISGGGSGEIAP